MRLLLPSLSRLLAVAGVASTVALLPTGAIGAAGDAPSRPNAQAAKYDGTFVGALDYYRRDELGGPSYVTDNVFSKVRSTMPGVRFVNGTVTSSGKGRVEVSGEGRSRVVSDGGEHAEDCTVIGVNPRTDVPPFLVPVAGKPTFYAFTSLSAVSTCTAPGEPAYSSTKLLPAIPVPVTIPRGKIGDTRITIKVDQTMPKTKCPMYVPATASCTYRLHGTLTLRRVPDIDIFEAPTKPVLKPKATKVGITATCSATCAATLEVRPLRGPGRLTTRANLQPRAGKSLTVKPGAKLRRAIIRSGGARLEVTYRSGALSKTYRRIVRS